MWERRGAGGGGGRGGNDVLRECNAHLHHLLLLKGLHLHAELLQFELHVRLVLLGETGHGRLRALLRDGELKACEERTANANRANANRAYGMHRRRRRGVVPGVVQGLVHGTFFDQSLRARGLVELPLRDDEPAVVQVCLVAHRRGLVAEHDRHVAHVARRLRRRRGRGGAMERGLK